MIRADIPIVWVKGKQHSQITDIPRIHQRLDDEPVVARLPEVRLALATLRQPVRTLCQTLQIHVLDPTPLSQHVELLRVVDRAASPESLADRPLVLNVRPPVGGCDVRQQHMVLLLRHGGPRGRRCGRGRGGLAFHHKSHRRGDTARKGGQPRRVRRRRVVMHRRGIAGIPR